MIATTTPTRAPVGRPTSRSQASAAIASSPAANVFSASGSHVCAPISLTRPASRKVHSGLEEAAPGVCAFTPHTPLSAKVRPIARWMYASSSA